MAATPRWLAPLALSAALGAAALAPAPARAQSTNDLIQVLVNVADVAMRGNVPYYRYGDYSRDDRLVAGRDRYGRTVYYRYVPRDTPPYGNAYGYYRQPPMAQRTRCNSQGRCRVEYYDPRYDRQRWDRQYGYQDNRYDYRRDRYAREDERRHDDRDDWDGD